MIRIGFSKDVHPLVEGRPFVLGGISIDYEKGQLGYSDGDCLLHAISESILGAVALGDLGKFFPADNPDYKDYDSGLILKEVYDYVKTKGYDIVNLDCMISLEQPKLRPHIDTMRQHIADILGTSVDKISIKATTHEGLGIVGEGKAIVCEAIVLLQNDMIMML
ncbi:MAG: 2-C-methyl-D-erythritol 2,4-cyclodiphosphate synthase [Candidatus Izemoplasmatales bacterium]|jgi:2-C-methyl-D-erythritol 2,4-cyclodiphosphate synthase|nr:2-C-methyl-D-erythritol 2,4-cyclodiphosphate synthase [Candidatus Izemoplasmatales bacterium]MDD5293847.1 2-C-methyl-D-erythritol 2,4-cyclodiphosphate synthase [Candidatus Izemoplasmatales bacterium]